MIQGGDIEKGDGTGIVSIFGKEFEDESLGGRAIDAAGLVCSANRGKDTNGSQYAMAGYISYTWRRLTLIDSSSRSRLRRN